MSKAIFFLGIEIPEPIIQVALIAIKCNKKFRGKISTFTTVSVLAVNNIYNQHQSDSNYL